MPVISRIISVLLRTGEIAFAAVVAGIVGEYLHAYDKADAWPQARFIYTEVIAGLSIILALFWLFPFTASVINWPGDLIMFVLWITAFGLLVNWIEPLNCGSIWAWDDITQPGTCPKWNAAIAFSFLSAIFWVASAILAFWVIHRLNAGGPGYVRRPWYRSHHV
jgi:hypothetical protein